MSIAGGYYKAVEAARTAGCDCVQLFSKNNSQWRAPPITTAQAVQFRQALAELQITHPLVHSSYLINLASPDDELWRRSIDGLAVELQRADQLGIPHVVFHPGAYVKSSEHEGLDRIVRALREVRRQTLDTGVTCLLETTAGQGTCLGHRFEHLAAILNQLQDPQKFGVCLDTCHIFAAGYPLAKRRQCKEMVAQLDQTVGLSTIKAIHLNDSKQPCGSRKDRHEHIGRGQIGLEPFRWLLNDSRFRHVPMYLETAKGEHQGRSWDEINLATLRGLIAR
jgi:deoxyribonuclease-4